MSDDAGTKTPVPPYLAFSTLQGFLESMAAIGLPHQIDKSIMKNMSGANQSWILSCLKFLRLTSDGNKPTENFRQLVSVDGEDRKELMKDIIIEAYSFIFQAAGFDIKTATPQQLYDQFDSTGVVGDTKKKSVRFFMNAVKYSGIEISSHLHGIQLRTRSATTNRKPKRPTGSNGNHESKDRVGQNTPNKEKDEFSKQTFNQYLLEKVPPFNPEWSEESLQKWLDTVKALRE